MLRAGSEQRASYLHAESWFRAESKFIVKRNQVVCSEPFESREQATCVLIASMLCVESLSMDVSKRVLC